LGTHAHEPDPTVLKHFCGSVLSESHESGGEARGFLAAQALLLVSDPLPVPPTCVLNHKFTCCEISTEQRGATRAPTKSFTEKWKKLQGYNKNQPDVYVYSKVNANM
jgi:hypothetical protein